MTILEISIHAPHEGERHERGDVDERQGSISIHAPHEGERPYQVFYKSFRKLFQSTLPTRGSDYGRRMVCVEYMISIHAPHEGERHGAGRVENRHNHISIHAPHEGERLCSLLIQARSALISIHAPHEGERPFLSFFTSLRQMLFQSTLPTRGSDCPSKSYTSLHLLISIHAPHEGERRAR